MIDVVLKSEDDGRSTTKSLPDGEAVAAILSGAAMLSSDQSEPPFALLHAIVARIRPLDVFGPTIDQPSILTKFSETVLMNGIRQTAVDGLPITWLENRSGVFRYARRILLELEPTDLDPIEQLKAALKPQVGENVTTVRFLASGSSRSPMRTGNSGGLNIDEPIYSAPRTEPGPDWRVFGDKVTELTNHIEHLVSAGLEQGRILCVEDIEGGSRLVHPKFAAHAKSTKKRSIYFCLSRDLPIEWFVSKDPKHIALNKAARWMKKCFLYFAEQGRRASSVQLQQIGMIKFGITEDAAKRAWKTASAELEVKRGAIPLEQRVDDKEIKDIE